MRVLVTGAGGFVGRALCSELARRGHDPLAAVREAPVATAMPEGAQVAGSAAAPLPCPVIAVGDIRARTDWSQALLGMDAVVHLAARTPRENDDATASEAYRQVNIAGTEGLARAAARQGVRRFVYVSSVKVNGERTGERPFTERDTPAPSDAYAASKRQAELALGLIAQDTGMETVVVRPPLVYGPGVGSLFLKLLSLAHSRLPIPLGAVDNQRSLIYVGNLADALVACLEHPAAAGQTFLVNDDENVSTPELIRLLAPPRRMSGMVVSIPPRWLRYGARLIGQHSAVDKLLDSLVIDGAAIRERLAWSPPAAQQPSLKETASWYQLIANGRM